MSADNGASPCSYGYDKTRITGRDNALEDGLARDPGRSRTIPVPIEGSMPFSIGAGPETNTILPPLRGAQTLSFTVDRVQVGGAREVTFSVDINLSGNTVATFDQVGQFLKIEGALVFGRLRWRVVANDGVALS